MSPDKMVHMANQIATFFDSQPGEAAEKIADHIRDFWEPRMREQLLGYIREGGDGLKPAVQEAAKRL
ncbi:formate dehydrogenase subunit delta [Paracoccus seriniphilus]|uniref:Formate dehydrogenase delta subunit n=1 Tax=Paracoccus seriniphilus TaxID=184748 RepID=A0A239PP22_9RHOB|nr:formate dehydrogenase subunit delta [Paracoccus seriniphilus]WCR14722.1 formate dehydrogenase subunit delta [Paracoccus seriniphilus]SNT71878.1 formate dehydrogenase delta subunit [Paracoccus seriniphilus]